MEVLPDTIDFDAYLDGPDENANVKPASCWLDQVIDAFRNPVHLQGAKLPWEKTHGFLRIRSGELTIWPGMNGHGKSLVITQIALSLMAQGEKVCIASMEMKPHETMQRMCRQAFGTNAPDVRSIRDLSRWTDGKLWIYDQQGQVNPARILSVGRYCHEQIGITHLIVDNLLSCGIAEDDYNGQKAFALALATHAHDTRQAVHLLAHSRKGRDELTPPSKYDVRGSASITDLADNVHTIWRNKGKEKAREERDFSKEDEADCLLIVDKNRHGSWEGRIKLWFDQGSQSFVGEDGDAPRAMKLHSDHDVVEF